ncbi:hypothetical protein B5M09_005974 [Aphanomyces astaci]|uniref:Nucleotide-diphospho-sugar transferase domain-containing protein n=1 Tax=Aphanomyces astaci TaxID=112090 RepID=A0A425BYQ4_APHAT|nr:hypothetical protein B5M09_005974 [Aphanomyces astaci]
MPLLGTCIMCLFVVYICMISTSAVAMKDGKDVYESISKDQWLVQIQRHHDFSSIRRGILVCVFDAMIPMAASLVLELRALGNTDLIQMYHCNGELSAASHRILYMLDARLEIVDVCKDFVASGRLPAAKANDFRSFWLKPLALVHTRLAEVILLDADDLMFHDPSQLWQTPGYKETGTVFFYDREVAKAEYLNNWSVHRFQRMLNLHVLVDTFEYAQFHLMKRPSKYLERTLAWNKHSAHEQDSSIVVVNKGATSSVAMDVLYHLVMHTRYTLDFSYGDKELFWLAFELAQVPYIFNPYVNHDMSSLQDPAARVAELVAAIPTHVSRQRKRSKPLTTPEDAANPDGFWPQECLYKRGSEAMRPQDVRAIERRIHSAMRIAMIQQRELALDKLKKKH